MSKIKVGINGYGTIGKRVADLVSLQTDMKVIGVSKINPNIECLIAKNRGFKLYTKKENINVFNNNNIDISGTIDELIQDSDIIIDCTPSNIGLLNKKIYSNYNVKVIWQGGENKNIAPKSFNSYSNYDDITGEKYARVVSCNTTGLCRILSTLNQENKIINVFASIIRRGTDLSDTKNGPIDSIVLDPSSIPSHHADDVNTILKDINIITSSIKIPTTFMHLHMINIEFEKNIKNIDDIIDTLSSKYRIKFIDKNIKSTSEIIEYSRDLLRPRNDIWENCIFFNSLYCKNNKLYMCQAIHQESIVVPENIDCIRSMFQLDNKDNSIKKTDDTLKKFNQM